MCVYVYSHIYIYMCVCVCTVIFNARRFCTPGPGVALNSGLSGIPLMEGGSVELVFRDVLRDRVLGAFGHRITTPEYLMSAILNSKP